MDTKWNSWKYPNFFDTSDDNVVKVWGLKVSKQKLEDVLVTTAPFNCLVIENFLHSPEFLGQLQQECEGFKVRGVNDISRNTTLVEEGRN